MIALPIGNHSMVLTKHPTQHSEPTDEPPCFPLNRNAPRTDLVGMLIFKENNHVKIENLTNKTCSIGRSSKDSIILNAKGVSRCHATIYTDSSKLWIIDGNMNGHTSTNGLFVNGKRVSVHQLTPFDVITFCKDVQALFLTTQSNLSVPSLLEDSVRKLAWFLMDTNNLRSQAPEANCVCDEKVNLDIQKANQTLQVKLRNALLDDLTKLPSRDAFLGRVQKSLELNQKISTRRQFGILFIDIDRFKMINDSLGHVVGDRFLIQISKMLKRCIREGDMVARLGGDEFAVLLDNLEDVNEAIVVAKRLQKYSTKPFLIGSHELYPSLSIGIALSSSGYQTVNAILRDADTALYHAKSTGKSRFVVFDDQMRERVQEQLRLDSDLRRAIERQELHLYYQPIMSLKEKRLVGFEALIRWQHPELGWVSPDVFIPLAEETNLINYIGQWALETACHQLSLWQRNEAIINPLSMNVNLSSRQLADPHFLERLKTTIKKYGIPPSTLKLEVTESILMENSQHSINLFTQLKELGVQLAIDDFGTGYSSLSYLHRFPIDALKVDRSFIAGINQTEQNTSASITHSIIGLAHSLGVKVVAEGIETSYHLAWLVGQRCDYGQGYLFAKPMSGDEATVLAENGINWHWSF
jgi:diguanylate cyclase (GGDEF)-like protein